MTSPLRVCPLACHSEGAPATEESGFRERRWMARKRLVPGRLASEARSFQLVVLASGRQNRCARARSHVIPREPQRPRNLASGNDVGWRANDCCRNVERVKTDPSSSLYSRQDDRIAARVPARTSFRGSPGDRGIWLQARTLDGAQTTGTGTSSE